LRKSVAHLWISVSKLEISDSNFEKTVSPDRCTAAVAGALLAAPAGQRISVKQLAGTAFQPAHNLF